MKASLRKPLFQVHLWSGLLVGLFLLIESVTGTILVYKEEIDEWCHPGFYRADPVGTRESLDQVVLAARVALGAEPTEVALDPRPGRTVAVTRRVGEVFLVVYVNPFSGAVFGPRSIAATFLFQTEAFHRHLFLGEPGYLLLGAVSFVALLLVVTGLWLWLPPTLRKLRAGLVFNNGLKGRAWWLGLHNVIGVYSAVFVTVLAFTAVVLVAVPRILPAWSAYTPVGRAGAAEGASKETSASLESIWQRFIAEKPKYGWATLTLPSKPGDPIRITAAEAASKIYHARSYVFVDSPSGQVLRKEPYDTQKLGRKFYSWNKSLHLGLVAAPVGRLLALFGAVALAGLVVTGTWLYLRRKFPRLVRPAAKPDSIPEAAPAAVPPGANR